MRAALGELYEGRDEPEGARRAFAAAAETLRRLAARTRDEGLREGFLSAPQICDVLRRSGTTGR